MSSIGALTYYEVLGVDKGAEEETLKAAYHQKALLLHPDKSRDSESNNGFQILQEAWRVRPTTSRTPGLDLHLWQALGSLLTPRVL
jgi:molecular chaperone DnaJ